ncbi:MAG: helix-turn-helix domain-containing protein [Dehalococcoidia bacterium]
MDVLTVQETAGMLKINPETVRRHIAAGRLPAVRIGRRVRTYKEDVEALATPITPRETAKQPPMEMPIRPEDYVFVPPSPEELVQRQALIETIIANAMKRGISSISSADLIHEAREQELEKYGLG